MKRQRRRAVGLLGGTLLALAVFLAAVWTGCGEGQVDNSDERGIAAYEEGDDTDPSTMGDDEFDAMMAEENQSAGMEEAGGGQDLPEDQDTRDIFAVSNPLQGIVGFQQINLTSARGSCGSHAGGVAIGYLRGKRTVASVRAVEQAIYNITPARPGASTLVTRYNRNLTANKSPWRAKLFHSSGTIAAYLKKGSPVVAHTSQWGGHYVCIYGLTGGRVYFSDGTNSDGVSAVLGKGYKKNWAYSTFLKYCKGNYIGFSK